MKLKNILEIKSTHNNSEIIDDENLELDSEKLNYIQKLIDELDSHNTPNQKEGVKKISLKKKIKKVIKEKSKKKTSGKKKLKK
jgi:hypothetical protein